MYHNLIIFLNLCNIEKVMVFHFIWYRRVMS